MKQTLQRNRNMPQGLTLVELLVSISLITVVSGLFMVAYRQASAEASNIRTQSTIRKISEIIVPYYEQYETRRPAIGGSSAVGLAGSAGSASGP